MSSESGIKRIDFFRYTPAKLQEHTLIGALISVAAVFVSIYLVLIEVNELMNSETKSELVFQNLHIKHLRVQMDIDLFNIPCDLIDVRFAVAPYTENDLTRIRISKDSAIFQEFKTPRKFEELEEAVKAGEGCKVKGFFHMRFLSNDFEILFQSGGLYDKLLMSENVHWKPDMTHRINTLTFGPYSRFEDLSYSYDIKGFNTLGRHVQKEDRKDGYGGPVRHSYYMTAVPNIFDKLFHRVLETFQYTSSVYTKRDREGMINFRIAISPISMHYFKDKPNTLSTIVQLFSIIGGLFMIAKIFDNYVSCCWQPKLGKEFELQG